MDQKKPGKKTVIKAGIVMLIIMIGAIMYGKSGKEKIETQPIESREISWNEAEGSKREKEEGEKTSEDGAQEKKAEEPPILGVHVSGAVRDPDHVVWLAEGSRVEDAIRLAGGAREDAALYALNLAAYLRDGQQIYVPTEEEAEEMPAWVLLGSESIPNQEGEDEGQHLTNLNLATKIELMELPGIGETYAQRIIEYREANGPFTSIEEIMNVSGIGENKFQDLKDRITVD